MKIISQNREENKVLLEVEEDYQVFLKAVEKSLGNAGKEIRIPGFRPGKAPRDLVEKVINRQAIEARAAQDLIAELYPQIIDESKIEPVDYPNIEIIQQDKDKPFIFKITVHVYPEVKLGKYKGLKAEKKKVEIKDEEVQKVLENLKERFAKSMPQEEGKSVALNDEFAKKVSRYKTLAELTQEIKTTMIKDREAASESDLKNSLIAAACAEAQVDLPGAMIDREIDIMLDELKASLSQSGLTLEDYLKGIKKEEKTLRDELRKSAEVRVRGKVVLREIANAEKLKVTEEELREEVEKLAAGSVQQKEEIKKNLDEVTRKFIEDYTLRRKALEFIVEKAKIKDQD